jgi:pimeloyl-ACP methyl ester carboxylesterase
MTGSDFALQCLGRGRRRSPVVALVHGMEDSWQSWRGLAGHLPATWRVYALDLPWRTGNSYQWQREATAGLWLAQALAALGEPVDVLVGHSLGANAVLELLSGPEPAGVRTAALLAPFYRPCSTPLNWALFDQARKYFDRIIADGLRVRLGPRADRLEPRLMESMLDKMVERIGPQGFIVWFDHFAASGRLQLDRIAVPTLVLANAADPCLADGRAEALAAALPRATVRLDGGYDHFFHIGHAPQAAGQLVRFTRTCRPRARTGPSEGNRA